MSGATMLTPRSSGAVTRRWPLGVARARCTAVFASSSSSIARPMRRRYATPSSVACTSRGLRLSSTTPRARSNRVRRRLTVPLVSPRALADAVIDPRSTTIQNARRSKRSASNVSDSATLRFIIGELYHNRQHPKLGSHRFRERRGHPMATEKWEIDAVHSSVGFTVRHMVVAKVHGQFTKWGGTLELDPEQLTASKI